MYNFFVVGAQKCGTTSLHKYLESVKKIELPAGKEAPFFDNPCSDLSGLHSHFESNFGRRKPDRVYGKCSPQYMTDLEIPSRILRLNGPAKIIILIRDPIERAYSQYKMEVRRNNEERDFCSALKSALEGSDSKQYLESGLYCKYIDKYTEIFGVDNVWISALESMEANPHNEFSKILNFLGIDVEEMPVNVGRVYHKGGVSRKTELLDKMKKIRLLVKLIKSLVPASYLSRFNYWYEQWNVVESGGVAEIDEELRSALRDFFEKEIGLLGYVRRN